MSGADDLARLTVTIDTANELFLSQEPKMIDVGGGVMRPTNAKVLADLATQMNGAQIYTSVALGISSTASGSYFSVPSPDSSEYLILYQNASGSPVEMRRYPSADAVEGSVVGSYSAIAQGLDQVAVSTPANGRFTGTDFVAWAAGFKSSIPVINNLTMVIGDLVGVTSLRLRVWSRPATDLGANGPGAASDTLLLTRSFSLNDLKVFSSLLPGFVSVKFAFDPLYVPTAGYTLVEIQGQNSSGGAAPLLAGRYAAPVASPDMNLRGYYFRSSLGGWRNIIESTAQLPISAGLEALSPVAAVDEGTGQKELSPLVPWPVNDSSAWSQLALADANTFFGWGVGFPGATGVVDTVGIEVDGLSRNSRILYRVSTRLRTFVSSTASPNSLGTDAPVYEGVLYPGEVAATLAFQRILLSFPALTIPDDRFVVIEVLGALANDVGGFLGAGRHALAAGETALPSEKGWYRFHQDATAWRAISDSARVVASIGKASVQSLRSVVLKGQKTAEEAQTSILKKITNKALAPALPWPVNTSQDWSYAASIEANAFFGWCAAFPLVAGTVDMLGIELDGVSKNHHLTYRVITRLLSGVANGAAPGVLSSDLVHYSGVFYPSGVTTTLAFQKLLLSFPALSIPTDRFVMVEVIAFLADGGYGLLGAGKGALSASEAASARQSDKGWFRTRNNATAFRPILDSAKVVATIGVAVDESVLEITLQNRKNLEEIASLVTVLPGMLDQFYPVVTVANNTLSFGGSRAVLDGVTRSFSGFLSLDATATGTETKSGVVLRYVAATTPFASNRTNAWLGRRHISNVSLMRADGGAAMVPGVDFNFTVNGKLRGLLNVSDITVSATFDYARERYDLIQIDPLTLQLSVVKGVDRDYEAGEYRPPVTAGRVALYYVLVVGTNLSLEPVYRYTRAGGDEIETISNALVLARHNRKVLRKTRLRLDRQQAITLIGHGDSITAVSEVSSPTSANGTTRDRRDFLGNWYLTDTMTEKYPGIDLGYGDGAVHLKLGWNWRLKEYFESEYGAQVSYLNFGLSGSTTASGASTERLGPILASGGHLMVLCFGMNDFATTTTIYANMVSIITQAKAAGMEVVVMPVPRTPDTEDGKFTLANWRSVNRQVYRAAMDAGAAYCPANWLTDESSRGGMGIAPPSLCGANLQNHPGGYEFGVYGEALINIFARD